MTPSDAPDPASPPSDAPAVPPPIQRALAWAVVWFRPHRIAFVILNSGLIGLNAWMGKPWWAFWPLLAGCLLFGVHYLVYKAMTADEEWAEERAQNVNLNSYDRGHIQDISARAGLSTPVDRALQGSKPRGKPGGTT